MVDTKEDFEKKLFEKIKNIIFDTHREIILNTPIDTGRLRNSIVVEETEDGFIIGSNLDYSEYVELGTEAHEIRPVNKQALKFKINGKDVIVKKVNHPGTDGHHMFQKGISYFENRINNLKTDI